MESAVLSESSLKGAESAARKRFVLGVMMMLLSGFGFALMNLFIRLAGDLPSVQKSFFRNLVAFLVSLVIFLRQHRRKPVAVPDRRTLGWLVLRSMLGTVGILANFYAIDHLPIANAAVLNKLSPFFTMILAGIFLKEAVNRVQISGIALAFAGVVFLARPDVGAMDAHVLFPILIGLLGGLAAGAAYTCVRYLAVRGVNRSLMICFFSGFSCLALLPVMLTQFRPMRAEQWLMVALIGVGAVLGQYGITFAYSFARPNQISIFDYAMVLFSALLGLAFLNQIPDGWSVLGMIVIFAAFLMMFLYNRRQET